ncbi:unnamed protein product [Ilex paraguariensis]|uniref:ZCF37 n=1 Tax=Ilex paraguariensis TaxID=185542 RepID=A0ABC8SDZ1_9AQUA
MFSPFICGSFQDQEEDLEPYSFWSSPKKSSPCSTPKGSRKTGLCSKSKVSKNPYANRGLDKFSELLAELEDKRQKIYTQKGSEKISFVRFVYSNSNDIKPIVVKLKDRKQEKPKDQNLNNVSEAPEKIQVESSEAVSESQQQPPRKQSEEKIKKKKKFTWNIMKMKDLRRPSYYLPVVIIFILLILAVFGRSFAILCTSIGWYLVPTVHGAGSSDLKRPKKKKEYTRRLSERKIVTTDGLSSPKETSPTSVITGPGQHGHRKSW